MPKGMFVLRETNGGWDTGEQLLPGWTYSMRPRVTLPGLLADQAGGQKRFDVEAAGERAQRVAHGRKCSVRS